LTFNSYTHFQHNVVPLHVASRHGQLQSISTLVKAGADLSSATKVGFILVFHQALDDKKMLTLLFCCDNTGVFFTPDTIAFCWMQRTSYVFFPRSERNLYKRISSITTKNNWG